MIAAELLTITMQRLRGRAVILALCFRSDLVVVLRSLPAVGGAPEDADCGRLMWQFSSWINKTYRLFGLRYWMIAISSRRGWWGRKWTIALRGIEKSGATKGSAAFFSPSCPRERKKKRKSRKNTKSTKTHDAKRTDLEKEKKKKIRRNTRQKKRA